MPQYIVRKVIEAKITADDIDLANYVGSALLKGEPTDELAGSDNWAIMKDPECIAFLVEED